MAQDVEATPPPVSLLAFWDGVLRGMVKAWADAELARLGKPHLQFAWKPDKPVLAPPPEDDGRWRARS